MGSHLRDLVSVVLREALQWALKNLVVHSMLSKKVPGLQVDIDE
jgi:hypothetical protein